jgi:hypothetical protein
MTSLQESVAGQDRQRAAATAPNPGMVRIAEITWAGVMCFEHSN